MKLTILIMTVCLMQVSALTNAQITINAKQESLRTVLKKISQQSGYDFIYSVQDFKNANPVDLKLKNVSIEKALSAAFYGQPLIYEVSDKTVMVKKQEEKSYLETVIARFQSIDVRGKVVDSLGVGLAGATVSIKGRKGSTSTSANGDFYLKNVEESAVLVISFMGYVTKEQSANMDFNYVILNQSTSQLDEVLVQAYGTTTRRLSTGNIAMITSKEISQQNINNPLLALQGRVAGVEVIPTSGLPGAPVSIKIRGQYTLGNTVGAPGAGAFDPLIVVDGVPYTNNVAGLGSSASTGTGQLSAFSFINPNEIESISILKDADATSIYGSRGAKGVVVIATKKGKAGQTAIDVIANSGWQEVSKKLDLLNTEQYLEMRKEILKNDGVLYMLDDPAIYGESFPELLLWNQQKYTDWQEKLLGRTAKYNDYQGNISGGSNTIQYRLGGTYHRETYVFPGDSYDNKGSANMSVTGSSPNQKFSATLGVGYMFNKNNTVPVDFTRSAMSLAPNAPDLYNANGELNWEPNPYAEVPGRGSFVNPLALLKRPTTLKVNNLVSNVAVSYSLLPNLMIKATGGYTKMNGKSFIVASSKASVDPTMTEHQYLRQVTHMNSGNESWNIEPQLTYNIKIGKGSLNALLGGTLQESNLSTDQVTAYGFNSDAVMESLNQATGYTDIGNTAVQYKYNAVFARLNYNWKDKYLINLSGRSDGSSRFGPGRQFGNFWSVGTAWIFTKENLIQSLAPGLSFGKVRFSYGTSGQDGIGDYQFMELYNPVTDVASYRGGKLLRSAGLSNSYYGWENVRKMEFGLDLGFFNDRLNLSSAFFRNRSSNLLGNYVLPAIAGISSSLIVNQPALIETKGWEFNLSSFNISKPDFSWNSALNFGFMRNRRIAGFDGDRTRPGLGEPFYGYASVSTFNGVDPVTGQYRFLDDSDNSTFQSISAKLKKIRTEPVLSGGITNSFKYKSVSLNIFIQFVRQQGRNFLYQFDIPGQRSNQPVEIMNRWREPGDEAAIQRLTYGVINPVSDVNLLQAYNDVKNNSSIAWVDASFVRLKTVSLSYDFKSFVKQKLNLKNLRFFAQGQNFLTWTKYKGTDPETQNPYVLPPLRTITAGIQLTL